MKTIEGKNYYNIEEVAKKLDVCTDTIRRAIKAGKLKTIDIGQTHISEITLQEYLKGN